MRKSPLRILQRLIAFLALLTFPFLSASSLRQEQPIRVTSLSYDNNFPDSLTFRLVAQSTAKIHKVKLYYQMQGSNSTFQQPLEFTPQTRVSLSYTWDTSGITVAPSSPLRYYWTIEDQAGNTLRTEDQHLTYDDLRFSWKEIRDEELIVRWYQGDQQFGKFIYAVAREALTRMQSAAEMRLHFPVYVLIYANDADFASWHSFVDTWVGGQAFPALGVTVEIIPPNSSESWIEDVIPHEIAHLFFHQTIDTGMASWPAWLDEGLAQYYEFGDGRPALERAAQAAREKRLLPLSSLSGSFGRDPVQVRLAYDQSYSAVSYILSAGGDQALQSLIESFRRGTSPRLAIEEALGMSWEEFEAAWITWMGVPATPAPPPSPTATYAFPTAPFGYPTVTPRPPNTPTPTTPAPSPAAPSPTPGLDRPRPGLCSPIFAILLFASMPALASFRRRISGPHS